MSTMDNYILSGGNPKDIHSDSGLDFSADLHVTGLCQNAPLARMRRWPACCRQVQRTGKHRQAATEFRIWTDDARWLYRLLSIRDLFVRLRGRFLFTVPSIRVLSIFLFCMRAVIPASSQESIQELSLNDELLETYIDLASNASSRTHWIRINRRGMEAVLGEWETAAALVFGDTLGIHAERQKVTVKLEDRLRNELALWAVTQFKHQLELEVLSDYWQDLQLATFEASIRSHEENPARAESEIGKSDDETATLKNFRYKWDERTNADLNSWYAGAETAYTEFLAQFEDEERHVLENLRKSTLDSLRDSQQRELSKMTRLCESAIARSQILHAESTASDLDSLALKSEAMQIITSIQDEIDEGLNRLRKNSEIEGESLQVAKANIDIERWQNSFQEELEKGLLLWERAEETLLVSRAQWERQAGYDLAHGIEAYNRAFEELKEARRQWQDDYNLILEQGRREWNDYKQRNANSIETALSELEDNIEVRGQSLSERLKSSVNMLGQTMNMMTTARKSLHYWLGKANSHSVNMQGQSMNTKASAEGSFNSWGGKANSHSVNMQGQSMNTKASAGGDLNSLLGKVNPDIDYRLNEMPWDSEEMASFVNRFYGRVLQSSASGIKEQTDYWLGIYKDYQAHAERAMADIYETYGQTVLGKSGLDEADMRKMLPSLENSQWEDSFLSEYQVELLKAKAVLNYWEKELETARAVNEFAQDEAAVAGSRKEKAENYEKSIEAYREALKNYQAGLKRLGDANYAMSENREKLEGIQGELAKRREERSAVEEDYRQKLLIMGLDSPQYFQEQIRDAYQRLVALQGEGDENLPQAFSTYLAAINAHKGEAFLSDTSEVVMAHFEGLNELSNRYKKAAEWTMNSAISIHEIQTSFLDEFREAWSLSMEDDSYREVEMMVQGLIVKKSLTAEEIAAFRIYVSAITAHVLRGYRSEVESVLNRITFLISEDALTQSSKWAGMNIPQIELASEVLDALEEGAVKANLNWIKSRIGDDFQVLNELRNQLKLWENNGGNEANFTIQIPDDFSDKQAVLHWVYSNQSRGTSSLKTRLDTDIAHLGSLVNAAKKHLSVEDLAAELRPLMPANPYVSAYLGGGSVFTRHGRDYGAIFMAESFSKLDQAKNAPSHWRRLSRYSLSGREMNREEAIKRFKEIALEFNLAEGKGESWKLLNPSDTWKKNNLSGAEDAVDTLTELAGRLGQLFDGYELSEPEMNSIQNWLSALEDYFFLKLNHFTLDSVFEELAIRQETLDHQNKAINKNLLLIEQAQTASSPLIRLAFAHLINPDDEETSSLLETVLAGELAANLDGLEFAGLNSLAADDSVWTASFEGLMNTLNLEFDAELASVLSAHLPAARVQAGRLVKEAIGIVQGKSEYSDLIMNSRLNGLSLEDYGEMIIGSKGFFGIGIAPHIQILKKLDEALLSLPDGFAWNADVLIRSFSQNYEHTELWLEYLQPIQMSDSIESARDKLRDIVVSEWGKILVPLLSPISGSLYADTLAAVLGRLSGMETAAWFFDFLGMEVDIDRYSVVQDEELMKKLYGGNEAAALYYLKRASYQGMLNPGLKDEFRLSETAMKELERFSSMAGALNQYIPIVDGELNVYLSEQAGITKEASKTMVGNIWDDVFFSMALIPALSDREHRLWVDEYIRADGRYRNALAESGMTALFRTSYEELRGRMADHEIEVRRLEYDRHLNNLYANRSGAYRVYLSYMAPSEETVGDEMNSPPRAVIEGTDEAGRIYETPSHELAGRLEAYNTLFEQSRRLTSILNTWKVAVTQETKSLTDAWLSSLPDSLSLNNIPEEMSSFEGSLTELSHEVEIASTKLRQLESDAASLKWNIASNGKSVKDFNLGKNDGGDVFKDEQLRLSEISEQIARLEHKWKEIIGEEIIGPNHPLNPDDDLSFRQAELLYEETYRDVRSHLKTLEKAKNDFRTAKAIYDHASNYNIYFGRNIGSDIDDGNGDTGLEDLQKAIDEVNPENRLAEVLGHYNRAKAVVDILEKIHQTDTSLLEQDSTYLEHLEVLGVSKREEIALDRLSEILEAHTIGTQDQYEKALADREKRFEQLAFGFQSEDALLAVLQDEQEEQVLLKGMDVNWDSKGKAIISYNWNHIDTLPDDAKRRERLKEFFGLSPVDSERETYRDLLHKFLKTAANFSTYTLSDWFGRAISETADYWGSQRSSNVHRLRQATFGTDPLDNERFWVQKAFRQSVNRSLHDFNQAKKQVGRGGQDYQFFKFLYLSDQILGTSSVSMQQLGTSWGQHIIYKNTVKSADNADFRWWHPRSFRRQQHKRDLHYKNYSQQARLLLSEIRRYSELHAHEVLLKERLDRTTIKGSLTQDNLLQGLGEAVHAGSRQSRDELLRLLRFDAEDDSTTGIFKQGQNRFEEAGKWDSGMWTSYLKDRFSHLSSNKASSDNIGVKSLGEVIQLMKNAAEISRQDSEEALRRYLTDKDSGIEARQNQQIENYEHALQRFQQSGLIPIKDIDKAEAALKEFRDSESRSAAEASNHIAAIIENYIDKHIKNADLISQDQKNLQQAMEQHMAANGVLETQDHLKQAVDYFGRILESYKVGKDFIDATQSAWENPVFVKRVHLSNIWKGDKEILDEFGASKSDLAALGFNYQLQRLMETIQSTYDSRMEAYMEVKESQVEIERQEGALRQEQWEKMMKAIYSRGNIEWNLAIRRLEREELAWKEEFQQAYQDNLALWDLRYQRMLERESAWVEDSTKKALRVGDMDVLTRFGVSTQEAIAETSGFIMPDMTPVPDMESLMPRILDQTMLFNLLKGAKNLHEGIDTIEPIVLTKLGKNPYVTGDMLDRIHTFHSQKNEEINARMSLIQYERIIDILDDAEDGLNNTILDANNNFAFSMRNLFIKSGFRNVGRNFVKNTLVMATLWESFYEDHSIEGYRHYETNIQDISEGLIPSSDALVANFGSTGIQALIAQAMQGLEDEQVRVFGENNIYATQSLSQKTAKEMSAEDYEVRQLAWEEYSEEEQQKIRYIEYAGGELGYHIGYAPQFIPAPDPELRLSEWEKNVRFQGLGEKGRMLGLLMQHQSIEAYALAELKKPFYEQKLWNDRGIDFKAITLRSAADIGMSILSTAVTAASLGTASGITLPLIASTLASSAVSLSDDLIFSVVDISTKYRSPSEVFETFGKKAVISLASAAIGQVGGSAFESAGFMGKTLITGARSSGSQLVGATVNAIDFNSENGDFFNEEVFSQSFDMGSIALGMAGSLTSFGLNELALTNYVGLTYKTGQILNRSIGNVVTSGLEYLYSGETTLNILNFADLILPFSKKLENADSSNSIFSQNRNVGLLELKLSSEKVGMTIGSGGHDFSIGTMVQAARGLDAYKQNQRIGQAGVNKTIKLALRTLYSASAFKEGDTTLRDTYEEILSHETKVEIGEGPSYDGRTVNINGTRYINLNTVGKSSLDMGVLLAHEAYRDGNVGDLLTQKQETDRAVFGHMNVAAQLASIYGVEKFSEANRNEVSIYAQRNRNPEQLMELVNRYDATADFWRLLDNGEIIADGNRGLYDERGKFIRLATDENGLSLGYGESLMEYMGGENVQSLLTEYGINIEGKTNTEIARSLMGILPYDLKYDDKNMSELIGGDYKIGKTQWLGNEMALNKIKSRNFQSSLGISNPGLSAGESVLDQIKERDEIISMMKNYDVAHQGGLNPYVLGKWALKIREMQAKYNNSYVKSGLSFTPENYVSQKFGNSLHRELFLDKDKNKKYLSYTHSGLDTVGSSRVVSPGFMEIIPIISGWEKRHAEEFGLIGSDVHFRGMHLNPNHISKNKVGDIFIPGQFVAEYGMYGNTSGPHLHLELTFLDSNSVRGFGDPLSISSSSWKKWDNFGGKTETYTSPENYVKKLIEAGSTMSAEEILASITEDDLYEIIKVFEGIGAR